MDLAQDAPDTVILSEDEAEMYLQATTMRPCVGKQRSSVSMLGAVKWASMGL